MSLNLHLCGKGAPHLYQTPSEVSENIRRLTSRECRGLAHDLAAMRCYRMWLLRSPIVTCRRDVLAAEDHVARCVAYIEEQRSSDSLVEYW